MSHHNKGEQGRGHDKQAGGMPSGSVDDGGPGRSASSPGHMKKAAGEQSARDFAPGRHGDAPGPMDRRGEQEGDQPEGETLV
jgi:hypothetical protein